MLVSGSDPRAVLAADMELGASNVLRTLTEQAAARAEWFQRHGIGRRDPVAVYDDGIVVGPTGKVRKILMRQQLLASTGAS
jgi:hypothetical protein